MERDIQDGIYSVSEAAEILQFHPDAVRYWLRVGVLAGTPDRSPEGWAIRGEALVDFLRESGESLPSWLAPAAPLVVSVHIAGEAM